MRKGSSRIPASKQGWKSLADVSTRCSGLLHLRPEEGHSIWSKRRQGIFNPVLKLVFENYPFSYIVLLMRVLSVTRPTYVSDSQDSSQSSVSPLQRYSTGLMDFPTISLPGGSNTQDSPSHHIQVHLSFWTQGCEARVYTCLTFPTCYRYTAH